MQSVLTLVFTQHKLIRYDDLVHAVLTSQPLPPFHMPDVVLDYVVGPTKAKGRGRRRKGASGELVAVSMSPGSRLPLPNDREDLPNDREDPRERVQVRPVINHG